MKGWPLDDYCAGQYSNPSDRRFHAQPIACPECGPHYNLHIGTERIAGDPIANAAELLNQGAIVAVKGLAG